MDNFWKEFIEALLMAFAPLLAGLLAAWLTVTIKRAWQAIKAERPQLAAILETAAIMAVHAAEQSGAAEYITDKKTYAIQYVQNYLNQNGWASVDVALIEGAIEAAVWTEINKNKATEDRFISALAAPSTVVNVTSATKDETPSSEE